MVHLLWIVPLLLAVVAFPRWSYSRAWGYLPAIGLTFIAAAVLALHLLYVI